MIRLGPEANGDWEPDFVGTTAREMRAWAQCFDKEVAAMRAVPKARFQFVGTRISARLISRSASGIQGTPMWTS